MSDEFLEVKRLVIEELVSQIDGKKEIAKEFGLTAERLDELVVKLADKWLTNPDFVVMLATVLGISMPRRGKEKRARYIG
ncbi:MAG TPA: hypothetical protein VJI12_02670 [archaeon]|nr:hypothetical protein [archaeon]